MNESTTLPSTPSRRTVLKAAAWSVPVIAAATAVPAFAASQSGSDLMISSATGQTSVFSDSSENVTVEIDQVTAAYLGTIGSSPTPAGSILRVTCDTRLVWQVELWVDDITVSPSETVTSGDMATTTFVLPMPIPVFVNEIDTPMVSAVARFRYTDVPYMHYPDFQGSTITVTPPGDDDPDLSNNVLTSEVRYIYT